MSRTRIHRSDSNQADIVKALRSLYILVHITSQVGDGFPDIVVGYQGQVYLFEIKAPGKRDDLTPAEKDWHETWDGYAYLVETNEEILEIIGAVAA